MNRLLELWDAVENQFAKTRAPLRCVTANYSEFYNLRPRNPSISNVIQVLRVLVLRYNVYNAVQNQLPKARLIVLFVKLRILNSFFR
jgi:hypothetical protein